MSGPNTNRQTLAEMAERDMLSIQVVSLVKQRDALLADYRKLRAGLMGVLECVPPLSDSEDPRASWDAVRITYTAEAHRGVIQALNDCPER